MPVIHFLFQSSAAPKGGCNRPSVTSNLSIALRFNPQPPRRAAATRVWHEETLLDVLFQSSAAPKGGCNGRSLRPTGAGWAFQSSAAPKGGCNP